MQTRTQGFDKIGNQTIQRGRVGLDLRGQCETFAAGENRHAMVADRAVDEDFIARPGGVAADLQVVLNDADAGGVDEELVPLAARNDLGVAGDDGDRGCLRRMRHRFEDPFQIEDRQPLFENEADAERQGSGAGHRQIVDRAIDGQIADITTREKDRVDDIGIGGEGKPPGLRRQQRFL